MSNVLLRDKEEPFSTYKGEQVRISTGNRNFYGVFKSWNKEHGTLALSSHYDINMLTGQSEFREGSPLEVTVAGALSISKLTADDITALTKESPWAAYAGEKVEISTPQGTRYGTLVSIDAEYVTLRPYLGSVIQVDEGGEVRQKHKEYDMPLSILRSQVQGMAPLDQENFDYLLNPPIKQAPASFPYEHTSQ